MDEKNEMSKELIEDARELGLLSCSPLPESNGESNADESAEKFLETVIEIAKRNQALALSLVASSMVLVEFRSSESGLHAFAVTEPRSGSDLRSCRTRLKNGRIYGVKTLITNAELAEDFAVLALDLDSANSDRPAGSTGLKSNPLKLCLVYRPGNESRIKVRKINVSAFRGSGIGVVKFDGVRVEEVVEDGAKAVVRILTHSRPLFSAIALGMAERCIETAANYAKRRKAFGKSVIEFQGLSFQLADCLADVEALRGLIYRAFRAGEEKAYLSAVCKLFAARAVKKCTDVCMEVLAGHGLVRGGYIERAYRDAKAFDVGEGTSEIMRLIISRKL